MTVPAGLAVVDQLVVGRSAERDLLQRAWREACAGSRRAVLVGGEPGVGKTTLAADLARLVDAEGGIVLHGRCDEDVGTPYQPFIEAIAAHAGVARTEVVAMLQQRMPVVRGSDGESERLALFDAALAFLDRLSERAPLLLVLDDIHWATTPTLLLLRHLVRAPDAPMLVLATFRDTEAGRDDPFGVSLAALAREPGVERLTVTGLDEDAVGALVAECGGPAEGDRVADLARRTGGNPFFVREMLEHLREADAAEDVPEGIREVIGRRLDRLPEETDRVLTLAAVIGASFTVPALEAVLEEQGDAVVDAVDEALAGGLLVEQRGRYVFTHTLVRDTILRRVSGVRRRRLHRRAAETLHRLGAADAATLAHHYAEAGGDAPSGAAAQQFVLAATEAHERLAYEDAAALALRGLEALADADGEGDRERDGDERLRIDLLLLRSWALRAARSDVAASKACALEAVELARGLDDPHLFAVGVSSYCHYESGRSDPLIPDLLREAVAALGRDAAATRSLLLSQLSVYLIINANDRDGAEGTAWEALGAAEEAADADAEADALTALVQSLAGTSRFEERAAAVERLVGLDGRGKSELSFGGGRMFRTCMAIERGDLAAADADLDVLRARLSRQPTWYLRYATITLSITRAMLAGRWDDAERGQAELSSMLGTDEMAQGTWAANGLVLAWERGTIAEALPMLEMIAAASPITAFRTGLAMYASEVGRDDLARPVLDDLLGSGRVDLPVDQLYPMALAMLANAAARLGERGHAAVLRDALEPYGGKLVAFAGATFCLGTVDRYLGMLAWTLGDHDEADRRFAAALELEERIGAAPFAARTAVWWARVSPGRGAELLERAAPIAEGLGMTALLAEIGALRAP